MIGKREGPRQSLADALQVGFAVAVGPLFADLEEVVKAIPGGGPEVQATPADFGFSAAPAPALADDDGARFRNHRFPGRGTIAALLQGV